LAGRKVADLYHGTLPAGRHSFAWEASNAGAGVYIARLQSGTRVSAGKIVIIK
jgi:hypothetical protein